MRKLLITLSILFTLISCGGAEERAASYLEKAKTSMDKEDYVKAGIDLKNVLQIDPKNPEAWYYTAYIDEHNSNFRGAFAKYNKAIELKPDYIDAMYSLGKIYLNMGDSDKTLEFIEKIESIDANDTSAKSLRAGISFSKKAYGDTIDLIEGIAKDERKPEIEELYAAALYRSDRKEDAINYIKEFINRYPERVSIRVTLAKIYHEGDNRQAAIKVFEDMISEEPDNVGYRALLSRYYEDIDEPVKAESVFRNLVDQNPGITEYSLLLYKYILDNSGSTRAQEYLEEQISKEPDTYIYKVTLARLYLVKNDITTAKGLIREVLDNSEDEVEINDAKILNAEIMIKEGDIDEAEVVLKEVLVSSPSNINANLVLSKIYLTNHRPDDAVNSLRLLIREAPNNGDYHLLLAKAHEMQGNIELAKDVISRALLIDTDNIKVIKQNVSLLIERKEYDQALNVLNKIRLSGIDAQETERMKAEILLRMGKLDDALRIGDRFIKQLPETDTGYIIKASVLSAKKDFVAASDVAEKGFSLTNSPKLLIAYINSMLSMKDYDAALQYLDKLENNDAIRAKMAGEIYLFRGDTDKALSEFRSAISLNPKWISPYMSIGEVYQRQKEYRKAIEIYKQGLNELVNNEKLKFLLATAYQLDREFKSAVELYEEILESSPDNLIAANNAAQLYIDEFDDESLKLRALELVDKIKDNKNTAIRDTVGWVYSANGRHQEAREILKSIVDERPDISIFKYHLGIVYTRMGDTDNARRYLEESIATEGEVPWASDAKKALESL